MSWKICAPNTKDKFSKRWSEERERTKMIGGDKEGGERERRDGMKRGDLRREKS